jgi:predicted ATPase/class 3 adenylate cyclase
VSFLFTDVERSTELWSDRGEAMATALAVHDRVVRQAIVSHSGYVFSTSGDGFAAAFSTPDDALAAAVEAQRTLQDAPWPAGVRLAVRMAVHTGAADERDGNFYGVSVNRAARVMGLAPGGVVLVSAAVAELVRDGRRLDIELIDVGEHRLRGLPGTERIFQVRAEGLVADATVLRSPFGPHGNLPVPATSFVGRVHELTDLAEELEHGRSVTLTGPGGVGKTRLAVEVATAASGAFADGAWMVELAPLRDADAVVHATAQVLGAPPQEGLDLLDAVVDAVKGRSILVVLDNCEHVKDAAAAVVERLQAVPTLAVLATSRERLAFPGERVWPVGSLDPTGEALHLFFDRAAAADARLDLGRDRPVVKEVCAHLDGLPLAIELAAARMRSMTPSDLAAHLNDRFRLLRDDRADGELRHRALRATVEWSYQSLSPTEAAVFERLSVMAGSFDLAAAAAVCADVVGDAGEVLDLLGSLIDKSLVEADRTARTARYRLLETLRQFGFERLTQVGDADAVRDRHLAHFVSVAGTARRLFEGDDNATGTDMFDLAWDNLRAALGRAVESGDVGAAEAIVEGPAWYSILYARHELGEWAEQACGVPAAGASAFGLAAYMEFFGGDPDRGLELAQQGVQRATFPAAPETVHCWLWLNGIHWFAGRADEADQAVRHAVEAARAAGDGFALAAAIASRGLVAATTDPGAVVELAREARAIAGPLRNPALDAWVGCLVGPAEFAVGERRTAIVSLRHALALAERCSPFLRAVVTMSLATVAAHADSGLRPELAYSDAIEQLYALRAWPHLWGAIESLATYWVRSNDLEGAATLLGHLDTHEHHSVALVARRARAAAVLEQRPDAWPWRQHGAALDRDQVVHYALERLPAPPAAS